MPYNNSVLIVPASIDFMNLAADQTAVKIRVSTAVLSSFGGVSTPDITPWIDVDFGRLALDTAQGTDGYPLFGAGEPVKLNVDTSVPVEQLPQLLLLHHSERAGQSDSRLCRSVTECTGRRRDFADQRAKASR
ncbi:MAG: hypothetical protein U0165_14515 [Polyangiaceae bacterium]